MEVELEMEMDAEELDVFENPDRQNGPRTHREVKVSSQGIYGDHMSAQGNARMHEMQIIHPDRSL